MSENLSQEKKKINTINVFLMTFMQDFVEDKDTDS